MSDDTAGYGEDALKGDAQIKSGHAPGGGDTPPFAEHDSAMGDRSEETSPDSPGEPATA